LSKHSKLSLSFLVFVQTHFFFSLKKIFFIQK